MLQKIDDIHISLREIDGYNLPFNAVICEREAGKSTQLVAKLWKIYKEGNTALLFRRNIVDVTEPYIESILEIIHKFYDESFEFVYTKSALEDGIVKIKDKNGKLIFIIIALSIKVSRIKSLVLRNIKAFFFDEFICNPKFDEKYLKSEADKFKEAYNTFYRETDTQIKCYFFGNPYSMYNPYFMWWGVDVSKLERGKILTGKNWAVWCYEITQELREYILKRNPLYQFDDAYTKYAFFGQAINDENIRLSKQPANYSLKWLFRAEGKYIGIYQNHYVDNLCDMYFCRIEDSIGIRRNVYCYDFNELVDRCAIMSRDDKEKFARFKRALQRNLVTFENIAVYYIVIEIYNFI